MFAPSAQVMLCLRHNDVFAAGGKSRRVARHKRFAAGKTLAQGEFTSPCACQIPLEWRRLRRRNPKKRDSQSCLSFLVRVIITDLKMNSRNHVSCGCLKKIFLAAYGGFGGGPPLIYAAFAGLILFFLANLISSLVIFSTAINSS